MTSEPELKPCPFCGGPAELKIGEEVAVAQCLHVSMHRLVVDGDNNAADDAITAWNTRAETRPLGETDRAVKFAERITQERTIDGAQVGVVYPEPRPALDGEAYPCEDCGGSTCVWFAPNELWNLVMGGPEAEDDPGGMLCPNCFISRAEAAGINPTAWVIDRENLEPRPAPDVAELVGERDIALAEVARLWEAMPYKQQIQLKFPVGARVEMSEQGLSQFPRYAGKTGTIMRHAVSGWSPSVKWDHRKTENSYSHEFLRVIEDPTALSRADRDAVIEECAVKAETEGRVISKGVRGRMGSIEDVGRTIAKTLRAMKGEG